MKTCRHCNGHLDPSRDNEDAHANAWVCVTRLRAHRNEAMRVAQDLITWGKVSDGPTAGAVIDAETRLARLRQESGS